MSQDNLTPPHHQTLSPHLLPEPLLEPGVQRQVRELRGVGEPQEARGVHKEEGSRGFLLPF